jgi:hypothetical protein
MLLSTQDKHQAGPWVGKLHHPNYLLPACRLLLFLLAFALSVEAFSAILQQY